MQGGLYSLCQSIYPGAGVYLLMAIDVIDNFDNFRPFHVRAAQVRRH